MAVEADSSALSGHGDPFWRYSNGSLVDGEICSVVLTRLDSISDNHEHLS